MPESSEAESKAWYQAAFEKGYLEVYPHRNLSAARVEVRGLVERGLRGPVLDMGCGFGRHSLAMLERGLEVFGMDLSADLLERSSQLGGSEALRGRLVRADFRAPPFQARSFASVTMLFSSFGYFDDAGNRAVAVEVARLLSPGGLAIFDLMNPFRIREGLVPESHTERDGIVLHERRSLSDGGARVQKEVELVLSSGARTAWHEDVRLYEPEEFAALLAGLGMEVVRVEGEFDGRPFDLDSSRQIVWARI